VAHGYEVDERLCRNVRRCEGREAKYRLRLFLRRNGMVDELKDVKLICHDCAMDLEFDPGVEDGDERSN
jgi:hypothetical protein